MTESGGITCPECDGPTGVIDSRRHDGYVRRRRKCRACGRRLTTFEKVAGERLPADEVMAGVIDDLPLAVRVDLLSRLAESVRDELAASDG